MTEHTNTTALVARAMSLIEQAKTLGLVLTIETKPRAPLAMGNYDLDVSVRPLRERACPPCNGDCNQGRTCPARGPQ